MDDLVGLEDLITFQLLSLPPLRLDSDLLYQTNNRFLVHCPDVVIFLAVNFLEMPGIIVEQQS